MLNMTETMRQPRYGAIPTNPVQMQAAPNGQMPMGFPPGMRAINPVQSINRDIKTSQPVQNTTSAPVTKENNSSLPKPMLQQKMNNEQMRGALGRRMKGGING